MIIKYMYNMVRYGMLVARVEIAFIRIAIPMVLTPESCFFQQLKFKRHGRQGSLASFIV